MALAFGISVIVSLILLLVANRNVAKWRYPAVGVGCWSLALVVVPACMQFGLTVVAIQGILMSAGALFARPDRPRRFLAISLAATLVAYGIGTLLSVRDFESLKRRFPLESMEARLPIPAKAEPARLSAESLEDLAVLDANFPEYSWRNDLLRQLHENSVDLFLAQSGFGVSRMMTGLDGAFRVRRGREPELPEPELPEPKSLDALSTGVQEIPMSAIKAEEMPGLALLHRTRVPAFFESGRQFGYVRDRKHVAGFLPHGFQLGYEDEEKPQARSIELVGLVVHPEPVVYRTGGLPTMANLPKIPTRPLDAFETKGLAELTSGSRLFVRQTPTGLRMLGPIRATKQCTECHGCERGRLLGAFSYAIPGNGS